MRLLTRWGCGRRESVVQAQRYVHGVVGQHPGDVLAPHRHRGSPGQRLMRPPAVVKADPRGDPGARLAAVGVALQVDVLVLQRPPQPFDEDPPGVAYYFSPDRKGEHPQGHLAEFKGVLQADAYGGFAKLYQANVDTEPRVREAACWAHLRRDFHDIWKATASPLAKDALERIGRLYDIEGEIVGQPAERRREGRQNRSRPHVNAFRLWCESQPVRIPAKGDLAKAMRYAVKRWHAFTLFLEDGRIAIDNNPAERAIRSVAIGRKNWLFAGSDAGGETLADAMIIIETAKLSGLNLEAYLADVLARINDHIVTRLDELLPWNWTPASQQAAHAA